MVAEHTERAKDLGTIQVRAYRGIQRESDETLALPHETGRNSHETLLGEDEVVLAEEALKYVPYSLRRPTQLSGPTRDIAPP